MYRQSLSNETDISLISHYPIMEEKPAEEDKTKIMIALIIVAIIVVASLGLYTLYTLFDKASDEGISEMHGLILADEIMNNINSNSSLIKIQNAGYHYQQNSGNLPAWKYTYRNEAEVITITIFSNNTNEIDNWKNATHYEMYETIHTWNINSSQAFEIAMSNEKIITWFESDMRSAPYIQVFKLYQNSDKWVNPIWRIEWADQGWFDNPNYIDIEIDAITGEIMEIDD